MLGCARGENYTFAERRRCFSTSHYSEYTSAVSMVNDNHDDANQTRRKGEDFAET